MSTGTELRETMHLDSDGKVIRYVSYQETDPILRAIKATKEIIRPNTGPVQGKYLGSVPLIICEKWAKDCGAALYSKEWKAYARRQLMSGEWSKLRGA